MNSPNKSFTDLSDDDLIIIFEKLDVEDLKNVTLTSTKLYGLVVNTQRINKKFKLKYSEDNNATIIQALMESHRKFEDICIPMPYHSENESCKMNLINDLMKKIGDDVKRIEFTRGYSLIRPKPTFEVFENIPNIEYLKINDDLQDIKAIPNPIIFNRLKEVEFSSEMFLPFLNHVNTLEKLRVPNECVWLPVDCLKFIEILRNNQSTLKSLTIKTAERIFAHDIQVLFKFLSYFCKPKYYIFRLYAT